jgi:hypothetical protein
VQNYILNYLTYQMKILQLCHDDESSSMEVASLEHRGQKGMGREQRASAAGLQGTSSCADELGMNISPLDLSILVSILAGVFLTLYIMRRRSRLGRRTPKF